MDFIIASMHRGVLPAISRKADTNALINAMKNPYVHIIGHPVGAWYDIDVTALVEAAARTNTILEVNEKSITPASNRYNGNDDTIKMLELCKKMDVPVLASSDAHFCTDVGNFNTAKALIDSVGLKDSLVLNTSIEVFLNAIQRKGKGNK
jgi:putative hydrolase